MNIFEMKKNDFKKLRKRDWDEDIGKFQSLVVIPTRRKHDSGFMCMEFVAVKNNGEPICRLGGGSDVVHIGGLINAISGWSMDCLPCGYLRLFNKYGSCEPLTAGLDVSDFELFAEKVAWNK